MAYIYNTVNIWDYSNFITTPLQINIDIEHKPCLGLIFQPPSHGRVSKKRDTILYTWDLQGELPFLQYSRDVASLGTWGPTSKCGGEDAGCLAVMVSYIYIYTRVTRIFGNNILYTIFHIISYLIFKLFRQYSVL